MVLYKTVNLIKGMCVHVSVCVGSHVNFVGGSVKGWTHPPVGGLKKLMSPMEDSVLALGTKLPALWSSRCAGP